MIAIGLLILIGIGVLIPALKEEEQLAERRRRVWNEGVAAGGIIDAKTKSQIGRKEVRYRYSVDGRDYVGERVIAHVDDFDPLDVGDPIMLRIDPKEPQFSVTALDVAPSFEDWIPVELLVAIVYAASGLAALYGLFLRRILRYGIEVPCTVQATLSPTIVRVTYAWRGVTRTRLVEGKCRSEGEPGAVLLAPTFPSRPLLGMHCRFNPSGTRAPSSMHDLRRRWASAMLPGAVGAWVTWGLLSLLTGESMSSHLRTACMLVVAIVLTFIGGRSDGDSPRQSGSATGNE